MNEYIAAYKIQENYAIPTSTLRLWSNQGKIRSVRLKEGGKRFYNVEDVKELYCHKQEAKICNQQRTIIYARVSSRQQKDDLDRQVSALKAKYPDAEVITDIGSTLNYKRQGLKRLLDKAHQRRFDKLVILYKDRLCRFAFDLFEYTFKKQGIKIEVVSNEDTETSEKISTEQEMAEDLLSVVNYFVAQ